MDTDGSLPLPQSGPARLIVEVLDADREHANCRARVPSNSPFRRADGDRSTVPAYLAIEMGAQAAALCDARNRGTDEGAIVAVRQTICHAGSLDADAVYYVQATLLESAPPLRHYRFEVSLDGRVLVEGVVGTHLAAGD